LLNFFFLKAIISSFSQLSHVDNNGQCPAVHAAMHGHLAALEYLLQCDWSSYDGQLTKVEAMQQALVAASSMGQSEVSILCKQTNFVRLL